MSEVKLELKNSGTRFDILKNFDVRSFIIVIALAVIWVFMGIVTKGTFLTARNLSQLFIQMSTIAVLAVGMVLVIVAGQIDMSVGSIVAFTGAVTAIMQVKMGSNTAMAIIIPILIGVLFTAFNGFWACYQNVPAFIVTLASMLLYRGLTLIITGGSTIASMNKDFKYIGGGFLPRTVGIVLAVLAIAAIVAYQTKKRNDLKKKGIQVESSAVYLFKMIGAVLLVAAFVYVMNSYQGIPFAVVLVIAATVVITFIATKTRFGRRLYAIGGNPEAAKLSGINIKLEGMKIYLILGVLAAISGMILTSRLDAATPSAGTSFEFDAISSAIIGGASFLGGQGTVFGALIGSMIMASLNNGMSILNMPTAMQYILKGTVLLLAVWSDIKVHNKGK